jgi:hypothetical protein
MKIDFVNYFIYMIKRIIGQTSLMFILYLLSEIFSPIILFTYIYYIFIYMLHYRSFRILFVQQFLSRIPSLDRITQ